MSRRLWHFTCGHGAAGIGDVGELRPHPQVWLDASLVWLTDLDQPFREALGLTSHLLKCDRTEHRFEVTDTSTAVWWPSYARGRGIDRQACRALEAADGAMPAHWWVSAESVPVRRMDR